MMQQTGQFELDDVYGIWLTPWYTTAAGIALLIVCILIGLLLLGFLGWYLYRPKRLSNIERMRLKIQHLEEFLKKADRSPQDVASVYDVLSQALSVYAAHYASISLGLTHHERFSALKQHIKEAKIREELREFLDNEQNVRYAHSEVSLHQAMRDLLLFKHLINQPNKQK